MNRLRTIFIVLSIFIVNTLYSCAPYEWVGFETKEQVIDTVKENLDDLNELSNKLVKKFPQYSIIQNSLFKTFNNSIEYKTNLSIKIFDKLKLDYIAIKPDNRIEYVVKNRFGYECGFYYSFDDNKNYYHYENNFLEQLMEHGQYVNFNNVTAYFDSKHGWYTEKICDNWYYFEEDFDYLNFVKYIYDDIIRVKPINKYYQEHKQFFEEYNPHKFTQSIVNID